MKIRDAKNVKSVIIVFGVRIPLNDSQRFFDSDSILAGIADSTSAVSPAALGVIECLFGVEKSVELSAATYSRE